MLFSQKRIKTHLVTISCTLLSYYFWRSIKGCAHFACHVLTPIKEQSAGRVELMLMLVLMLSRSHGS